MNLQAAAWSAARRRMLGILAAWLLLAGYIGFLMASNYRSQTALHASTLRAFRLDLEKRAASLGYFFSERKYDLRTLAASREIDAYFVNRSLGISEDYGLKVSFFVIHRRFQKTIREKRINNEPIYLRLLLLDPAGRVLVDSARPDGMAPEAFRPDLLRPDEGDPVVFLNEEEKGRTGILLAAPCFYRNRFAGQLVAWLDVGTLVKHLVGYPPAPSRKNLFLASSDGKLICPDGRTDCLPSCPPENSGLLGSRVPGGEDPHPAVFTDSRGGLKVIGAGAAIRNTPMHLVAWVPYEEIYGSFSPRQLLLGTGSLALVLLLGTGALIRFNTQNLVLRTRFDESERQQELLASKNRELEAEIRKRVEAEKKLEEQRALSMRSDRLRSLGEMAAGIAHELNQPLVGVRGLAELIQRRLEEERAVPAEKVRKEIALIVEQADRMVHIINHVRLFARETGKPTTSLEDLNGIVRSATSLLETQFRSHGFRLETELYGRCLPVRVNPYSVEEVILNLLANARHALEERRRGEGSGGSLRVRIRTGERWREGRRIAWLEVEDNACGIPASVADKIFDPFFTTKGPDRGTGLGLSISRSIVEEVGGTIRFSSEEGKGTVFIIEFPSAPEEKEPHV